MRIEQLTLLWFLSTALLYGESLFSKIPNKLVLSNGYIKNYIEGEKKEAPHYIHVILKTDEAIDKGYVYCLKTGSECIDNLEGIVDTNKLQFVTVGDLENSYFFIKKETEALDILIPVVKGFIHDGRLSLGLKPVQKLEKPFTKNELSLPFTPFKAEFNLSGNTGSAVAIANPTGYDIVVTDIFNIDNTLHTEKEGTLKLTDTYQSAGFCLTIKSEPGNRDLIEGEDYFCKIKSSDENVMESLEFPRVYRRLLGHLEKTWHYIEVAKKPSPPCYPHELLDFKTTLLLVSNGYRLYARQQGKNMTVSTGPYLKKELAAQEDKLYALIHSATR